MRESKTKQSKNAKKMALYRARKKGDAPPKKLAPCGTRAAAQRHLRNDDCTTAELKDICLPCYEAMLKHSQEQYRRRKAKKQKESQ